MTETTFSLPFLVVDDEKATRDFAELSDYVNLLNDMGTQVFSKGVYVRDPPTGTYLVQAWVAPVACTLIGIRGFKDGFGAVDVGAQKWVSPGGGPPVPHLAVDLVTVSGNWAATTDVLNENYGVGDYIEFYLDRPAGSVSGITIQADFTRG